MTADEATRRADIARAIVASRRDGDPVTFHASGGDDPASVTYSDREVVVELGADRRPRLEALLEEFAVFKIAQPSTRKAPGGTVHVSAIADPKHVADFLDRVFLDVFGRPDDYELGR